MRIMREETFGPVLPVMPFDTDDEAVRLANDSEYGLAASIWTRDSNRGERLARRIDAGTVMVNDVISCFGISEAPHGGVKASGVGRTHGRFGLDEMVRLKYLDVDRMPGMKKVWWYGYGESFPPSDGRISRYAVCAKSATRSRALRGRRVEAKATVASASRRLSEAVPASFPVVDESMQHAGETPARQLPDGGAIIRLRDRRGLGLRNH